jgi:delta14-sterol reductase/lamin-B receptor
MTTTAPHSPPSSGERIGMAAQIVLLPAFSLYVVLCVRVHAGAWQWPDATFWRGLEAPNATTLTFYAGWIASQLALAVYAPGRSVPGPPLAGGGHLEYRLNGFAALVLTAALAGVLVATGAVPASLLYDELVPLAVTINLGALGLSTWIFFVGRRQARGIERERGLIEAFYLGACLNPRSGPIDWKYWMQGKPGLALWALLAWSCAAAQYERHGAVSNSMWLVCLGVSAYVIDYFWHERTILSAWDVKNEPMGWMLTWGSCAMVPLVYAAPAPYLVAVPTPLPLAGFVAVAVLGFGGLVIFRQANNQKHRFRLEPESRIWGHPARWVETPSGTRLLCSGWWGLARHCNYLGDWMMALAWSAATGFGSGIPWIYPVFFAGLLIHRERRDHAHCQQKHGAAWTDYCARVRWRIVPFVY